MDALKADDTIHDLARTETNLVLIEVAVVVVDALEDLKLREECVEQARRD